MAFTQCITRASTQTYHLRLTHDVSLENISDYAKENSDVNSNYQTMPDKVILAAKVLARHSPSPEETTVKKSPSREDVQHVISQTVLPGHAETGYHQKTAGGTSSSTSPEAEYNTPVAVKDVKKARRPRKLPETPNKGSSRIVLEKLSKYNLKVKPPEKSLAEELAEACRPRPVRSGIRTSFSHTSLSCDAYHAGSEASSGTSPAHTGQLLHSKSTDCCGQASLSDYYSETETSVQSSTVSVCSCGEDTSYNYGPPQTFVTEDCEYFDDEPKIQPPVFRRQSSVAVPKGIYKFEPARTNHDESSSSDSDECSRSSSILLRKSRHSRTGSSSSCHNTSSSAGASLQELEATHRGCHKFVPRHRDELFIEIGDPIHVFEEADDLWCDGYNLRTGKKGIFPSAYATDLSLFEEENDLGDKPVKFSLRFLGSVEVGQHRGTEALCQAINKAVVARRAAGQNGQPPPMYRIEINEFGIKLIDRDKKKKDKAGTGQETIRQRVMRILNKHKGEEDDHFFPLKNVSFCGCHPRHEKYFGFITKHPLEMRFACHVFLGEESTKCVAEAVGSAFKRFYQQYMAFTHPTEDIYIE